MHIKIITYILVLEYHELLSIDNVIDPTFW